MAGIGVGERVFGGGHLRERELEREGGFRPLVFIDAVVVQAVAAAAGGRIVQRRGRDRCGRETTRRPAWPRATRTDRAWRGRPPGRRKPSPGPRPVAGRNRARSPFFSWKPLLPIGRKWPAADFCCAASQRRLSRPISSACGWGIAWPLRMSAWLSRALS